MNYLELVKSKCGEDITDTITYKGRDYDVYGEPTYRQYSPKTYHDPAEGGWDLGGVMVIDAETGKEPGSDVFDNLFELIEEKCEYDRCHRAFRHRIF